MINSYSQNYGKQSGLKVLLVLTILCLCISLVFLNTNSAESQEESAAAHTLFMPFVPQAVIESSSVDLERNGQVAGIYKFTLRWSQENAPGGTSYIIRESQSPSMEPLTQIYRSDSNSLELNLPASTNNVYYYTVQADITNANISQPFKVVGAYRDDFTTNSGWDVRRQDFDDTDNVLSYQNGHLKMHVRGRWDFFVTSPLAEAPPPPYRISTRVKLEGPGNLNTYGVIFGGDNNGGACPTIFPPTGRVAAANVGSSAEYDILPTTVRAPLDPNDANNVVDNCLNHYYRMLFLWKDGFDVMHGKFKQIHFHDGNNSGRGDGLLDTLELKVSSGSANDWNDWAFEVYPNGEISLFSGAEKLVTFQTDGAYVNDPAFGFWASTDEYPGSDPLWDYILVEPIEN